MAIDDEFVIIELDYDFDELLGARGLGAVTRGRMGRHLTRPEARGVPLVRTTTAYPDPTSVFNAAHERLSEAVVTAGSTAGVDVAEPFNNALEELYDHQYRKMGYHSDQALDLAPQSTIAIVSCYLDAHGMVAAECPDLRHLIVKRKDGSEHRTIELRHGTAVLFSTATNARHQHKIVLPSVSSACIWHGVTLRTSSSFIVYGDGGSRFADGTPLTLATDSERRAFFSMRAQENRMENFSYPPVNYTLSPGDMLRPQSD